MLHDIRSFEDEIELDYLNVNKDIHVLDEFNYDYKVKTGDLLSVQIKTITPVEFDFFNQTKELHRIILQISINYNNCITFSII